MQEHCDNRLKQSLGTTSSTAYTKCITQPIRNEGHWASAKFPCHN